jgi:hypothetical protein
MAQVTIAVSPDVSDGSGLCLSLLPIAAEHRMELAPLIELASVPMVFNDGAFVDPVFRSTHCDLLATHVEADGFSWNLVLHADGGITASTIEAARFAALADLAVGSIYIIGEGDLEELGAAAYRVAREAGLFLPESEVFQLTHTCRRITKLG